MSTTLYQAKELSFNYRLGKATVLALNGVSVSLRTNKMICMTGPSGSGKSTLLNLMGLIEPLQKGDLFFLGKSLRGLSEKEKNHIRRH